jgi:hypothetical protein
MKSTYKLHDFFELEDDLSSKKYCDYNGCKEEGLHRAPKNRNQLNSYYWFCLEHVREYNATWNFYDGMDEREIDVRTRNDYTWERPTWPFGMGPTKQSFAFDIHDPFNLFDLSDYKVNGNTAESGLKWFSPGSPEAKALALMDLDHPLCKHKAKKRYKDLVKKHHPDANGGCPKAEEKLKAINLAYEIIKKLIAS